MKSTQARLTRRNFLIALGAGSAATAAAVAVKATPKPETSRSSAGKRHGAGYEESAHVRNYYRTTKI